MTTKPRLMNMKAVLRLTGLTPETLRAWERRYATVVPARSASGRRLYSTAEVERLRLLSRLVKSGHAIGQIAGLSDRELAARIPAVHAPEGEAELGPAVQKTIDALRRFDLRRIRIHIARMRYELAPKDFMFLFVPLLMAEVGRLIVEERLNVAQEHALSELVQRQLRQIYEGLESVDGTRSPSRSLVFAAPEGHFHEIGLILVATLARAKGFLTQHLGPNLPAADLARAAVQLRPHAIVLSIADLAPEEQKIDVQSFLALLGDRLPKSCDLWIGGPGTQDVRVSLLKRKVFLFETLEDYAQKLERI